MGIKDPWDGSFCGTEMYLAPEVSDAYLHPNPSGGYSPAVDVWAAGVVLYILLTARVPFSEDMVWKLGQPLEGQDVRDRVLHSSQLKMGMSPDAHDLLERLLELDPADRSTAA